MHRPPAGPFRYFLYSLIVILSAAVALFFTAGPSVLTYAGGGKNSHHGNNHGDWERVDDDDHGGHNGDHDDDDHGGHNGDHDDDDHGGHHDDDDDDDHGDHDDDDGGGHLRDALPPICAGQSQTVDGAAGIDGTGTDNRTGDSGIRSVTLGPGSMNLTLEVDHFSKGAPSVSFRVEQSDPDADAQGTIIVEDKKGNQCSMCMDLRTVPEGPTEGEVLCCGSGILFQVSNEDMTPGGLAVCSSAPLSEGQPELPPGYEGSPEDDPAPCTVLTIDSPISGTTTMVYKKDGTFDPDLRLLFSRSPDGGMTFPPFQDITDLVEEIATVVPDPTKVKGNGSWSVVKVTCAKLAEICDGLDNDGDGLVDEGMPADDTNADDDGFTLCGDPPDCNDQNNSIYPGATEVCNGMDDDCDGDIDEALGGAECLVDGMDGACAQGITACVNAQFTCEQSTFPSDETCDGVDNDCDDSVDEDFAIGLDCDGVGSCGTGITECATEDSTRCSTDPGGSEDGAMAELCDGADNDCDGSTDEGFGIGGECEGTGECGPGVVECFTSETTRCSTDPGGSDDESVPETCDSLDNDCDGLIDETCNLSACVPTAELCDGLDNDCDGSSDEGHVCASCPAVVDAPSPEVCNGVDDDCDGIADDGVFAFEGFVQPVNSDGTSIFTQSDVIPFMFGLKDCAGNYVNAGSASIEVVPFADEVVGSEAEVRPAPQVANAGRYFGFDGVFYFYNLNTRGMPRERSYVVRTTLPDGTHQDVVFSLR